MKTAIITMTYPFQWICRVCMLAGFVAGHLLAAPVRAVIYWGRMMEVSPGWRGLFCDATESAEFGVWCPRQRNSRGNESHKEES